MLLGQLVSPRLDQEEAPAVGEDPEEYCTRNVEALQVGELLSRQWSCQRATPVTSDPRNVISGH